MSKSSTHAWLKYIHKPWFTTSLILLGLICCAMGVLLLAGFFTTQAIAHLQRGEYSQARASAQRAKPIVGIYNAVSLGVIPDLVVWNAALTLPDQVTDLADDTAKILQTSLSGTDAASIEGLLPSLNKTAETISAIEDTLPRTYFLKKKIPTEYGSMLPQVARFLRDIETLIASISQGKQTWVVLLQNSEEVRATGGFPGSYVLLKFENGALLEIVVEDIYDADGQFTGYIAAPPGIREYTSGNKGLRLPDANWWPDFPTSAQTMLQFFALGDKNNIAGVVALNLDAAKAVLEVTGPLLLPDYDVVVTAETVGEVLRTERSEFFPGSTQKKHLLQLTLTQLKQKLAELNSEQQHALLRAFHQELLEKEVQLFSTRPELQEIFSRYAVTGEVNPDSVSDRQQLDDCHCLPLQLAIVESNVGINKVNRYVSRHHQITVDQQTLTISTTFTNNAAPLTNTELSSLVTQPAEAQPRNGNGYLNYHRVLISPEYTVESILVGNTALSTWDEEIIRMSSGAELLQIGALVGVPEHSSNTLSLTLKKNTADNPEFLVLYKQSGIPASKFSIRSPRIFQEFNLSKDTVVEL